MILIDLQLLDLRDGCAGTPNICEVHIYAFPLFSKVYIIYANLRLDLPHSVTGVTSPFPAPPGSIPGRVGWDHWAENTWHGHRGGIMRVYARTVLSNRI